MNRPLVLVVEDSLLIRTWLAELIAEAGFRVQVARDGHTALAAMDTEEPDLILTDLYMPNLAGMELVRRIRAREGSRDTPVVVHTCEERHEALLDLVGTGIDALILKPADPGELLARIASLAHTRRKGGRPPAETPSDRAGADRAETPSDRGRTRR